MAQFPCWDWLHSEIKKKQEELNGTLLLVSEGIQSLKKRPDDLTRFESTREKIIDQLNRLKKAESTERTLNGYEALFTLIKAEKVDLPDITVFKRKLVNDRLIVPEALPYRIPFVFSRMNSDKVFHIFRNSDATVASYDNGRISEYNLADDSRGRYFDFPLPEKFSFTPTPGWVATLEKGNQITIYNYHTARRFDGGFMDSQDPKFARIAFEIPHTIRFFRYLNDNFERIICYSENKIFCVDLKGIVLWERECRIIIDISISFDQRIFVRLLDKNIMIFDADGNEKGSLEIDSSLLVIHLPDGSFIHDSVQYIEKIDGTVFKNKIYPGAYPGATNSGKLFSRGYYDCSVNIYQMPI